MEQIFADLENGNLTNAKKRAKRYDIQALWQFACNDLGWSATKAKSAALYLKNPTPELWQNYCDISAACRGDS